MKEKPHRLAKELYRGRVSAAFTLCIKDRMPIFLDTAVVEIFTKALAATAQETACVAPVYCFMPDHQHVILIGTDDASDILKTIGKYKQKTGYWLSRNRPEIRWQKDFFDHVIRKREELSTQVRYILDNPVRKGLVSHWQDHLYKGAIGCDLDQVLNGII